MTVKSTFREGTRVVNCYILSKDHGKHGVIRNKLFNSKVKGWTRVWAWIQYDDGTQNSEMKKYLAREDEVTRLTCPCCKHLTGIKTGEGYEGNLKETQFECTDCGYSWWIPDYLLKRMKIE